MNHKVIGITGAARAGKDTVANYLIHTHPHYVKMSFSEPIKKMLSAGLGLSHEQLYGNEKEEIDGRYKCSARHMMQTLGTEWGRCMINGEIWVNAMEHCLKDAVIIPDVRFPNEAKFIRNHGPLIHVEGRGGIDGGHVSEGHDLYKPGDIVITNSSTIEALHREVRHLFKIEAPK